jgi:hypothetical protein
VQGLDRLGATQSALIPAKIIILYEDGCWEGVKWDTYSTAVVDLDQTAAQPPVVQQLPCQWEQTTFDFHWYELPIPRELLLYLDHEQDALRFNWPTESLVAGTDEGVQWKKELVGAGYICGWN